MKTILRALKGETLPTPPIWMMRQAGRYLPEYRATRAQAGDFLKLCYNPDLAAEVTLQPIRRFGFDAAILFADILLIAQALGTELWFETGEGPRLSTITGPEGLRALKGKDDIHETLSPVYETVRILSRELPRETTLIGFAGAPWTVATYMIGGKGSSDQAAARLFALEQPQAFEALMDVLVEASIDYLVRQFEAGADVVQLFESWAMNLDEEAFQRQVIEPNRRIVEGVRARVPDAPIIGFPRGAAGMIRSYAEQVGVNMLGLDYSMPLDFARTIVPQGLGVQGNLDPLRLVAGGAQMRERTEAIVAAFADRPHIFNLGHGIVPQTPIAHVAELVDLVVNR